MTRGGDVVFEDYLFLGLPVDRDLDDAEASLGLSFPASLRGILRRGAGMTPTNLSVETCRGYRPSLRCVYHPFLKSREPYKLNTSDMRTLGYGDGVLVISDGGGVRLCLDYRKDQLDPPVALFVPSEEEGSEAAFTTLAGTFEEFLGRYVRTRS